MELSLYNTLTRSKEVFKPISPKKVGLYTCGFTVYDYAHIGNLRSYIFADVLKRALMYARYEVNHIENITDVGHLVGDGDEGEDKMEMGSRKAGKTAWEIAMFFTNVFKHDLELANVLSPTVWAPATEFIPEQIEFIKILEQKGYTYPTSDGIYFDTSKLSDYGKLAHLDIAGLKVGARVQENQEKKNITDFALWKFSPENETRQMEWESPWGKGFPGWHIECSAISTKFLGDHFDIHTGGIDHIPVHHTNEIAQNEARFGHPLVNYWLHNNFLTIDGTKMSKSLGNLYTLKDIQEKGYSPLALRYLYLQTHYRQTMNFTWEALEAAHNAYNKLVKTLASSIPPQPSLIVREGKGEIRSKEAFYEAISDDLNTPRALAEVWENIDNPFVVYEFDKILGLNLEQAVKELVAQSQNLPTGVTALANEREHARQAKDWGKADDLRKQIEEKGYEVEDSPTGPRLSKV